MKIFDSMKEGTDIRRAVASMQIKEAMARQGITRKQLADKMGKKPSEMTRWLSGTHNFTLDVLSEISSALGEQITGVVTEGYAVSPGAKEFLCDSVGQVMACDRRYCIGPIELSRECFQSLERKATKRGEDLGAYIRGLLVKEAVKPAAKASDFCGIWCDGSMGITTEEIIADIRSHRSVHKDISEL